MASPRLHHFSIACSSFNDCFTLYLEPLCFRFLSLLKLWWRSILAASNVAYLAIVDKIFILHVFMHHLVDLISSMLSVSAAPLSMRCILAVIRARIS